MGGNYALLDSDQHPLPASLQSSQIDTILCGLYLLTGLLDISPLQEASWNQSSVCKRQFEIWTLPEILCPLC